MLASHRREHTSRFQVTNTSGQIVNPGLFTRSNWDTVLFDILNEYDETVNYQFVAAKSGTYFLKAQIEFLGLAVGDSFGVALFLNGVLVSLHYSDAIGGVDYPTETSRLLQLVVGDIVHVEVWHNSALPKVIAGNVALSSFEGFRVY